MPCIPTVFHDFEEAGHDSLSGHTGQHTKQLRKYLEQHCPTHTFPSICTRTCEVGAHLMVASLLEKKFAEGGRRGAPHAA